MHVRKLINVTMRLYFANNRVLQEIEIHLSDPLAYNRVKTVHFKAHRVFRILRALLRNFEYRRYFRLHF